MRRWLVWNVLFRLHEAAKGHPTYRMLKAMEDSDRLSSLDLEKLRRDKLQQFLDYCYLNVPYVTEVMRQVGVHPRDMPRLEDLALLPLMTKADARRNRDNLRSRKAKDLRSFATGGSTGTPLIFNVAKRRIASQVACRQRVSRWWGVSAGDSEFAFWGSPVELNRQDRVRVVRDRLLATRLLSAFEMNEATMSRYLDILEAKGCRQIFAYPSAIYQLCVQARKQQRDLRNLGIKAVFVTGEVLFPYQRELIAETLNCPVANGYGGRDSGFIAHECPQGGMHLMADSVIVEIVDQNGNVLPPGMPGEIVVTDLHSHEAPFLRYATGDIGVLSTRPCSCGRAAPLLQNIEGRSNDCILAPDGRLINSLALIYPVRETDGIEQFRIIQKAPDYFHLQIVIDEKFDKEGEKKITQDWTKLLRSQLHVTFEYLPHLSKDPSGKFRHVVSEIPAERQASGLEVVTETTV